MINRRLFLQSLGILGATAALDPEQLLWTPKKTIFIPKLIKPYETFRYEDQYILTQKILWRGGSWAGKSYSIDLFFEQAKGYLGTIPVIEAEITNKYKDIWITEID